MPSDYVSNHAWVRVVGRPDAIDDIADGFERPVATPAAPARVGGPPPRDLHWPLRSRGWRSSQQLQSRSVREPA